MSTPERHRWAEPLEKDWYDGWRLCGGPVVRARLAELRCDIGLRQAARRSQLQKVRRPLCGGAWHRVAERRISALGRISRDARRPQEPS